ncbi:MAG: hypothetical protein AAF708_06035 [Deinococcota bacterium]
MTRMYKTLIFTSVAVLGAVLAIAYTNDFGTDTLSAQSVSVQAVQITDQVTEAASLPLLGAGTFLGTTYYGTSYVPDDGVTRPLVDSAAQAGMSGFTLYADWPELEPTEGVYNLTDLAENLTWLSSRGIRPYLNLTVVDIDDLNLYPDWLTEDGSKFADGRSFADADIIARFSSLLDQVVPLLLRHGGYYLGLGNEVDGRYSTHLAEYADYLQFVDAARAHVHSIEPKLAVGVTVTAAAPLGMPSLFQRLQAVTDILPFDYYGYDGALALESNEDIHATIDKIMDAYGDNLTLVQETNCPSATASGSSPDLQAACLEVMLESFQRYPQIRYISVFSFSDFDSETCEFILDAFRVADEDLPNWYLPRLEGFLCEIGMVAAEGTPKPAWDVFLAQAQKLSSTVKLNPQ